MQIFPLLLSFLTLPILCDWLQIDRSFTGLKLTTNSWSGSFTFKTCNVNDLEYVALDWYLDRLWKTYNYKSFQKQIILEAFFDNAVPEYSDLQINCYDSGNQIYWTYVYYLQTLTQKSNRLCIGGADYAFSFKTFVYTTTFSSDFFTIYMHFANQYYTKYFEFQGIRNLLVYINQCFPRCLTCSGSQQNQCNTCYYGYTNSGECNCHPKHKFAMTQTGCLQECPRNYYLTNQNFICVPDRRISAYSEYFTSMQISTSNDPRYSPYTFLSDPSHEFIRDLISKNCYFGNDYVGQFLYNEGIQLQMTTINALKFLRLRITLIFKNMETDSAIVFFSDNIQISEVKKTSKDYEYSNLQNIFQIFPNTTSCDVVILRLETIFKTNSLNPLIRVQGSMSRENEFWGFYNVTIDAGLCQENCEVCQNYNSCSQCLSEHILYQGECLKSLPVHSQNGVDYSEELPCKKTLYIQDSRYLAKGFYDLNMTIDDINFYFDSVTNENTNFQTGQKFSFFSDKFVLGGPMIWYDASYIKQFNIAQPHYAVSIRFNFTFGDEYAGSFSYIIDSVSYGPFTVPQSGGQNLVGKLEKEITQFFYIFLDTHTSNTLKIQFKCEAPSLYEIRDGFCVISDYFIVVHYCQPFCLVCTSATECISWQNGHTSSTCDSNYYLSFDKTTKTYSCNTCNPESCYSASTLDDECVVCNYKTYPTPQFTYLSGNSYLPCNLLCENCYGPYSNNCFSCNTNQHRQLINSQCVCEPGYYAKNQNLACYSRCGDMIVVDGEDCDDGNFNPLDGCDFCKRTCDENCEECTLGYCQFCIEGYTLIQNHCFPICNDNIQVTVEQCEDNNLTPYDGCYNCKYSCSIHCINCVRGICRQCDEKRGWYLQQDNTCQPLCGDNIIVYPYEICDNNGISDSLNQCFQCQYEFCDNCLSCVNGKCSLCNLGWNLNYINQQCETICGDGIIVKGYEECDDAITLNCHQCKYKCQDSCVQCKEGGCKQCDNGWELNLINQYCYRIIRGDTLESQPDYAIQYHQSYSCQLSCKTCVQGQCEDCKKGYLRIYGRCYEIYDHWISLGFEFEEKLIRHDLDKNLHFPLFCKTSFKEKCYQCQKYNPEVFYSNQCFDPYPALLIFEDVIENVDLNSQLQQNGYYCPLNCEICDKGQCYQCNPKSGYGKLDLDNNQCKSVCGDGLVMIDEECDDNNTILHDGCFNCKNQCSFECKKCQFGKCLECNDGYNLNDKINTCVSFCGDQQIASNEDCDDGNQIETDGCADCKFACHQQCTTCVKGRCYSCEGLGWKLNLITKNCETVCGDRLVAGNEQCDDGNDTSEDGCTECNFECQTECQKCESGNCKECIKGWKQLEKGGNNQCAPYCGDEIVIVGYEDCDDGNTTPFDGCFQCKYQCQEQCTVCKKGVCYECNIRGWNIYNHLCYPVCGDRIIVHGYEQCDDGNDESYDGCNQCFYQCEKLCTSCLEGVCYECNYLGWLEKNHVCVPRCGDGLIKGNEQCDDMNNDENDGCHNCQFKCDEYCVDCQEGICFNCDVGRRILQSKLNRCETECGDGVYIKSIEQCDDGNDINKDGCDNRCKIEKDWICQNIEYKISTCFFGQLILSKIPSSLTNIVIVLIKFTQQMKRANQISGEITDYIVAEITNMEINQYLIIKTLNQQVTSTEVTDVIITLTIQFFAAVNEPELEITINNNPLISQYDQPLFSNKAIVLLPSPPVLSDKIKQIALSTQSFNKAVIYGLSSLSSLCLITGSTDLFWNLLDQLQYLSFIKYINIDFPRNLNIYFEVFKLITIQPALSALKFDYFFGLLDGTEEYYVSTQGKFNQDNINGYFLLNFQSFLFYILGGFLLYFLMKHMHIFMYRIDPYQYYQLNFTLSKLYFKVRRICKKQSKFFFYNGILRIIMSSWYDLSFAVLMQLANYEVGDIMFTINYQLAEMVFILQIIFQILVLIKVNNVVWRSSVKKKNSFRTLFEDVINSQNIWIMQYNSILLVKKQLFIIMIVFMQQQGTLQAICIAILQTIFLIYLMLNKPLSNSFEYYKSLITEIILIFNVCSFLIYAYQSELNLSSNSVISLGWVHIFSSTMILALSCIFDFIQQSKIVIGKIVKAYKKKLPIVEPQIFERPNQKYFEKLSNFF